MPLSCDEAVPRPATLCSCLCEQLCSSCWACYLQHLPLRHVSKQRLVAFFGPLRLLLALKQLPYIALLEPHDVQLLHRRGRQSLPPAVPCLAT